MMARWMALKMVAVAFALGACQQEVVKVHESSIARQFGEFNKNGWAVNGGEVASRGATPQQPNRDVRVVKEADFSHLTFHTNLQIDDPKAREEQRRAQTQPGSAPLPGQDYPAPALPMGT